MKKRTNFYNTFEFVLLTLGILVLPFKSFPQGFSINDVIVSDTSYSICDAEYNSILNMYCHATNFQGLYVGDIDPNTGNFLQPNGLGTLLDYSMISTVSTITRNGCEWGLSQQGHEIFYTDSTNEGFGFKLGRMRYANGNWVYVPIDSSLNRTLFNALKDSSAQYTGINYAKVFPNTSSAICSQFVDKQPFLETNYADMNLKDCRWIKGWNAVTTRKRVGLVTQGGIYDLATNQFIQVTSGVNNTDQPYCIQSPDLNNDFVFWCITKKPTGDVISIHRKINGNWTFLYDLRPSTPHKIIESPESFVYDGRTYISLVLYPDIQNGQSINLNSQVWVMSIDTASNIMRLVSDTSEILVRRDPEYYFGNNEVFIYYTEERDDGTPKGKHVIHKCSTGISLTSTGIVAEELAVMKLKIFPNPTSYLLHIQNSDNKTYDYKISNLLGQTILIGKMQMEIDVSQLPTGIYILQLKEANGKIIIRIFIKE